MQMTSILSIVLFFSSATLFGYLLRYFLEGNYAKKQLPSDQDEAADFFGRLTRADSKAAANSSAPPLVKFDAEGVVYKLECENNRLKEAIEVLTAERQVLPPFGENGQPEQSKMIIKELVGQKELLRKNNEDLNNTVASLESQFRDLFAKSTEKIKGLEIQLAESELSIKEQTDINDTLRKQVDELYEKLDKKLANNKTKTDKNGVLNGIGNWTDPVKHLSNNVKLRMHRLQEEDQAAARQPAGKTENNKQNGRLKEAATLLGVKVKLNDLKLIEGIGPKIETLFHNAGIKTWQELALTTVARCREILQEGGERFQLHNPTTWPRQSKLLAEGKWKQLKDYQLSLTAGNESIR
jgi:predicted flap endonuclease-1-like 5' DNA nuclease